MGIRPPEVGSLPLPRNQCMMSDMSYDLTVLAADPSADDAQVRAMYDRCTNWSKPHPDGDLDDRIVAFYEELRARYPDHPPYSPESPWNSTPLGLGIDHVSMCLATVHAATAPLNWSPSLHGNTA